MTAIKIIQILGYLGLIPFFTCAGLTFSIDTDLFKIGQQGLIAYGACILTFLGAIHWGTLYRQIDESNPDLWQSKLGWVWGVTPSLIAFSAMLTQGFKSCALLIAGLSICWVFDQMKYPDVFKNKASLKKILQMRTILTVCAITCLTTGMTNL
jgi:hypothetical protein